MRSVLTIGIILILVVLAGATLFAAKSLKIDTVAMILPRPSTSLAPLISQETLDAQTVLILRQPTATPLADGELAPEFSLAGLDDKFYSLQEFRGKRIILNFWATWCVPCRIEVPLLQHTYEQLKDDGLIIIAVNMGEENAPVQKFVDEFNITFPVLLDHEQTVSRLYRVVGLPMTFFIDERGIIRATHIGGLTSQLLEQYLEQSYK